MSPDKLAYMANQIGRFFATQQRADKVAAIEDHLRRFWEPRMRAALRAHRAEVELDPLVRQAAERLKAGQSA
jgi:formate dehydrogenase subunit delta